MTGLFSPVAAGQQTSVHDPKTVLCTNCKHSPKFRPSPYITRCCFHPKARSVIDGSGTEITLVRHFRCKGEWWEERPPEPPEKPKTFWATLVAAITK